MDLLLEKLKEIKKVEIRGEFDAKFLQTIQFLQEKKVPLRIAQLAASILLALFCIELYAYVNMKENMIDEAIMNMYYPNA